MGQVCRAENDSGGIAIISKQLSTFVLQAMHDVFGKHIRYLGQFLALHEGNFSIRQMR